MAYLTDRLAFFHCPRTGGKWVHSVFMSLNIPFRYEGYAHGTPADNPPHKAFSFTIVRDPADWLASWRRLVDINPTWGWPVPDWLLNAHTIEDAEAVFARYSEGVDKVIHLSNISQGLQEVFDAAGVAKTVPDVPPTKDSAIYWPLDPTQEHAKEKARLAILKAMVRR